ncbi:hypothetical protein DFH28DRAFT_943421 [Melampsora americana]|nr:hypothetical protein DFH28DRAFT_943421 [Melampsora americana]
MSINFKSLSRREEDEFQKQSKLIALKSCDQLVSEFANCSTNRTFSVVWSCRSQWKSLQSCLKSEMSEEKLDQARLKFIQNRQSLQVPYQKL